MAEAGLQRVLLVTYVLNDHILFFFFLNDHILKNKEIGEEPIMSG